MAPEQSERPAAGLDTVQVGPRTVVRSVWRRPWIAGSLTAMAIAFTASVSLAVMSIAIRQVLLEDLRTYLQRTAQSAAALIDPDAHALLTDSSQTNTASYEQLVRPLRILLRTNPDIRFAYTGVVRGDTMFYILDGDSSSQQAWVMERDVPTEGERVTSSTGELVVERTPTPTAWGTGIRAYVPLAKAGTAPHPYVGLTMDAERFDAWMRRVNEAAMKGWLAAALIALLVGVRTARAERRREDAERDIARMREAALVSAEERHALEQRLQGRQKMEALGTLAGGVAHDFNNLLTIVLGHSEMLTAESPPGTEVHESAVAIRTAATRARDVVRRILLFARPEAEHRRTIDLVPIVSETVHLLRSSLPTSITLRWLPVPGPALAVADPAQMTQVLMNLAMNARQALPSERGTIEFTLDEVHLGDEDAGRRAVAPGPYVRIQVRDNGVGMTETVRRRVFEPFFTTKAMEQGTGLGLSVVEGVVRGHDGAVDVASVPGEGACFTLYLPRSVPAATSGSSSASRPGTASGPPVARDPLASAQPAMHGANGNQEASGRASGERSGRRVLLLDDDVAVLRAMTRVLIRAGYAVEAFSDAQQAVRALAATPGGYGVLVTDRTMPELSGLDVARRVHALDPGLPIVLLSGAVHAGDRESDEFALVLGKPPESAELVAAIEQVLAGRRRVP